MHAAGLQWAHLEMKGGKRAEIEMEGEERCWQMDAVCSLAQYPKRLTSSRAVSFFFFSLCCGFSERVLKDNPIFSPTAPTPPAHPLSGAERRFEYSKLSTLGFGSLIPRYPMAETPGTPDQPNEMPD